MKHATPMQACAHSRAKKVPIVLESFGIRGHLTNFKVWGQKSHIHILPLDPNVPHVIPTQACTHSRAKKVPIALVSFGHLTNLRFGDKKSHIHILPLDTNVPHGMTYEARHTNASMHTHKSLNSAGIIRHKGPLHEFKVWGQKSHIHILPLNPNVPHGMNYEARHTDASM
jgi:hypothetical protein